MILSTMTYEEMYREISHDFRNVLDYYQNTLTSKVSKSAQRSHIYPWRKCYFYRHPKSKNQYVYLSIVKKHSLWEKPGIVIFCEYEGKFGKEIITVAIWKDRMTFKPAPIISVFQAHFFKRYFERFIKDDSAEVDKIVIFLARNAFSLPISDEAVSANELLEDEPGYINTALLNIDGLCLGKISKENRNIIIYKTFVPFGQLFKTQFEKVLQQYIQMLATQACKDYPHCQETINAMYNNAVDKFRQILTGDNPMSNEERIRTYLQEYQMTCSKLYKYVIL